MLCLLKVKQYVVIFSWQFDTHVKESQNYTVGENKLKGAKEFSWIDWLIDLIVDLRWR